MTDGRIRVVRFHGIHTAYSGAMEGYWPTQPEEGVGASGFHANRRNNMRLIDADELMEHVNRDRLDSRELIEEMVQNAPTIKLKITGKGEKLDLKDMPKFLNQLACFFGTTLGDEDTMFKLAQCSFVAQLYGIDRRSK